MTNNSEAAPGAVHPASILSKLPVDTRARPINIHPADVSTSALSISLQFRFLTYSSILKIEKLSEGFLDTMASNITVLYPRPKEGEFFNMEYYINTHMPLATEIWKPFGLTGWQVVKFGPDAPFYGGVLMTWEKADDAQKALTAPKTKDVLDDVPNFTNLKPTLIPGSITGSWELK